MVLRLATERQGLRLPAKPSSITFHATIASATASKA
jgi:hypothetical protein